MGKQNIVELSDSSWEKNVEKAEKPVMVMFYSTTCPNCIAMEPHFEKYADEFKEKVVFARVNAMKNPTIASRYGVMGTPTFKFFCSGQPIQELVGAVYPELLKKAVEHLLEHGSECARNTTQIDYSFDGYA